MRLGLYKRVAAAADAEALDDLQAEVGDRFGNLPPPAAQLFHNARLTLHCRALGIRRLDVSTQSSYLVFEERNSVDPGAVISLLRKEPRVYRMEGPLKLRILHGAEPGARFEFAQRLLAALGKSA
jgi:transcription-repair coupling factor (superfamily II helicase)